MTASSGYLGMADLTSDTSEQNALTFMFRRLMSGIWTSTPVLVMAVTNTGGVAPVGYVDIMPMIAQVDGEGNTTPHGTIHHVPYFRIQGGANAVIIDPQINDIGMAMFAMRDSSVVQATAAPSPPGSFRTYNAADGFYIGGWLNAVPSQYIQFSPAGITVVSPAAVQITAPVANVTASTSVTVTAPTATVNASTSIIVNSPDIRLGGAGATKALALNGDLVVAGAVVASSTRVKAL